MRKQSNRMFSSLSGMELRDWLPCRQEWSLGRWLGYVSQGPPSEGSHQAGPLCCGGCTASHRALLVANACNMHVTAACHFCSRCYFSSAFLLAELAVPYPSVFPLPAEIVPVYPRRQPAACSHLGSILPLPPQLLPLTHCCHLCAWTANMSVTHPSFKLK